MKLILKYFPELSEKQTEQFRQLDVLYHDWNAKINVISGNPPRHHVPRLPFPSGGQYR